MDKTQKAIHARMDFCQKSWPKALESFLKPFFQYSQAITVIMILATAGLAASPKQLERERFERDQRKNVLGPEPTPKLLKKEK